VRERIRLEGSEPGPVADMSSSKTRKSVSPAERMRLLRTRRRNGLRSLRVMLHDTEIDCLVTKGFLKSELRHDHAAIQSAINDFICYSLGPEQDQPA
jgi:hypothetical protein